MNEKTTIIKLPEEMRSQLENKLHEYKNRLNEKFWKRGGYTPPEEFSEWYAIQITEVLLRDGQIDTWALCREIYNQLGDSFDLDFFENYCAAMDGYTNGTIPLVLR